MKWFLMAHIGAVEVGNWRQHISTSESKDEKGHIFKYSAAVWINKNCRHFRTVHTTTSNDMGIKRMLRNENGIAT